MYDDDDAGRLKTSCWLTGRHLSMRFSHQWVRWHHLTPSVLLMPQVWY